MGNRTTDMKLALSSVVLALAVAAVAAKSAPTSAFTYGHAAYTYGPLHCVSDPCSVVPSCNKAHWASSISDFNTDTSISDAKITQVYSYGGDVEFWPSKNTEQACWAPADMANCNATSYYDKNNKAAAAVYAEVEGVESITALLDARMDGWDMITQYNNYDACDFGDFYPNLNNLTDPQIEHLGQYTAELYCHDDNLGGIQVDLEPYQDPYKESLEKFVTALATNLEEELTFIPDAIGSNGKFTIALPISASCHEYEQYIPMHGDGCGPACQVYDANADLGIEMYMYVQAWMDILTDAKWGDLFKIKEGGQFIGLSFWVWTYDMTYPPMKWFNNVFLPPTPSDKTLQILKKGLPKLNA